MNRLKMNYLSPETELLVVRFEENIMSDANGYHVGGAGRYDDDDTNENGDF